MTLTKYEKETIINFNDEDDVASIYTCSASWILMLDRLMAKDPRITLETQDSNSKTYLVSKKAIKVRLPRILSTKQRKERAAQAKRNFSK